MLNPIAWLILGGLLILLEFLIPGLIVIFIGTAAIITAGLIHLHWIREAYIAVVFFVFASVLMLATLRRIVLRFYPSYSEVAEADEDALIIGQHAEAITDLSSEHFEGRVRYSGTTWPARSNRGNIAKGTTVAIVGRENINLIVGSVEP
jgi:inner membrane protein